MLKRLRRIEGQVRGIEKMVEEDRYCIDVLQQMSAAKAALDKVLGLLNDHVNHCMAAGSADEARRRQMTEEMLNAVGQLVRR